MRFSYYSDLISKFFEATELLKIYRQFEFVFIESDSEY